MKLSVFQAVHLLEVKKRELSRRIISAERQTIREAKGKARILSSGTLSKKAQQDLAKKRGAGVYSQANPDAALDPAIINAHTGAFRDAWFADEPTDDGGSITSALINDSKVADYMKGTRKMIRRTIIERIAASIEQGRAKRIKDAIDKVMEI